MTWVSPKRKQKEGVLTVAERKALVEKTFEKMDKDQKLKDISTALSRRLAEVLKGFKPEYRAYSIAVASHAVRRYVAMTTYDFLSEQKVKKEEAEEESGDEHVEVLDLTGEK